MRSKSPSVDLTANLLDPELEEVHSRVASHYLGTPTDINQDESVCDVALTLPLLSWSDGITEGRRHTATFHLAAAAAELPPERFHLPSDALRERREP